MLKIKFSHNYCKLENVRDVATLVYVGPIRIDEDTPEELLLYDTSYLIEEEDEFSFYTLAKGDYVLLLFISTNGQPFTTIRSRKGRYGDKLEYYSQHIGEQFKIIIKEDE